MKLLLIDGHYYVYRSFFAIQNLSNSRGEPTNAIFGFTKTLRLMIKHLQPELGAVFWDEGLPQSGWRFSPPTRRRARKCRSRWFRSSIIIQSSSPSSLDSRTFRCPNTEADDLMGCYALAACKRSLEVVLATNDKDLLPARRPLRESLHHGQGRSAVAERRVCLARRSRK